MKTYIIVTETEQVVFRKEDIEKLPFNLKNIRVHSIIIHIRCTL